MAGALAIVLRNRSLMLVRRRNPPDAGLWGYPGGKIELGETIAEAAVRELREETGVQASATRLMTPFDIMRFDENGRIQQHFILLPVLCAWVSGEPVAASDALDAAWFELDAIRLRTDEMSQRVEELAHQALMLPAGALPAAS